MTASPDAETARLDVWLDERFEEQLQFSPMNLTVLGRKDRYDEIDDISEQAARDQAAWGMSTVEQMKAQFDRNSLSTAGKESFDLWVFQTEKALKDLEFMRQGYLFGELVSCIQINPSTSSCLCVIGILKPVVSYTAFSNVAVSTLSEIVKPSCWITRNSLP